MREDEADQCTPENFGTSALALTVAELCELARSDCADALDRCDLIVRRFENGTVSRRHRASSVSALHFAVRNRMPDGAAKAYVDACLVDRLKKLQREGRFEASSNARVAFSQ